MTWTYDGTGVIYRNGARVAYLHNEQAGRRGDETLRFIVDACNGLTWLRARCTELEQAIEVIKSSRDICLNTFTAWCTEQYGPAKHALRMEPEYKKRIEALEQELEQWRNGGVTEDLLRKQDGYIKLGNGCVIVREDEWQALAQREVKEWT